MNNTEKKLDALIDALGFDVEQIRTRNNETYNHDLKVYRGMLGMMPANGRDYIRTEFKLTKRDKPVDDEPVNHEWTVDTNTGYAFDDKHTKNANRPPLGLTPKSIHDGVREEEIISTMVRYLKVGKAIPDSWLSELNTLQADRS